MRALLKYLSAVLAIAVTSCGESPTTQDLDDSSASVLESTLIEGVSLRVIGTPNRKIMPTNAVLLDPEAGIDATVLQGHHNRGDGLVVRFQPSTGKTEYIETPGGGGSWSVVSVGGGEAYLGSHLQGFLYHLSPGATELERTDLPRPDDWIWSLDRASDGNLYLGTYPGGEVLRYDIGQQSITDLGPVLEDDGRARYVRSTNGEFPGKLYLGMGAEPELVEWDIETGKKTHLLPEKYKDRSFVYNVDRVGDFIAATLSPRVVILLIDPATRQVVHEINSPNGASMWLGNQQSLILHANKIYFGTRGDDMLWAYDLKDRTTREVAAGIGGPLGLAQDRYLFTHNYFGTYYVYDLQEDEIVIERATHFEGAGMDIHTLGKGPDGTIAGGIYINQGFFSYDPSSDSLFAPGPSVSFGGQIDQIVSHDGLIYLAHYTTARLTVYDPELPWNPGSVAMGDPSTPPNPRLIGKTGHDQDRFPTAIVGSDGLIYLGSVPKYGKLGGALVVHKPGTDALTVFRNVVENQSVLALVEIDGMIYGSTAITGGLGSKATEEAGKLFAWNMESQKKTMEMVPIEGAGELWGLDLLPDGRIIGSADSALYVFDPATKTVEAAAVAAPEVIIKILVSQDGWVYVLTQERFIRATLDLKTIQTLDVNPDWWDSLVETDAGQLFVSRGAELVEVVRTPRN